MSITRRRPSLRFRAALYFDRYIGKFLCALVVPLKGLGRGSRPAIEPGEVRSILLVKLWGMGSISLASVLLPEMARVWPNARVDVLTLRENAGVLELLPHVSRKWTIDLSRGITYFLFDAARTLIRVRRARYDLVFDLEFFTRFSALFSFFAAPRRSHGFSAKGKWRGRLHDVEVPFNAYDHVAANFLTLVRGHALAHSATVEVARPGALPAAREVDGAWDRCAEVLSGESAWDPARPTVLVNPHAGEMALERRWPADRFAATLRAVADDPVNIVVVGSAHDRTHADAVISQAARPNRIINLAGRITVPELSALASRAAVMLSNDSGPLHIGTAAGISTVALFGPETPVLYRPLLVKSAQRHEIHYAKLACSPCIFVHDDKELSCWFAEAKCMTAIEPQAVLASIRTLLLEKSGDTSRRRPAAPAPVA
jgi:ADP-heptose:LPS heptosyltransferase